ATLLNPYVPPELEVTTAIEAFSVKIDGAVGAVNLAIENNLLVSNYGWFGEAKSVVGLSISGNELKIEGDGAGFIPVQGINYGTNQENLDERATKGLRIIDSVYFDDL